MNREVYLPLTNIITLGKFSNLCWLSPAIYVAFVVPVRPASWRLIVPQVGLLVPRPPPLSLFEK
jgi:hypothetical protein